MPEDLLSKKLNERFKIAQEADDYKITQSKIEQLRNADKRERFREQLNEIYLGIERTKLLSEQAIAHQRSERIADVPDAQLTPPGFGSRVSIEQDLANFSRLDDHLRAAAETAAHVEAQAQLALLHEHLDQALAEQRRPYRDTKDFETEASVSRNENTPDDKGVPSNRPHGRSDDGHER
jgi:hypothetical protein